MSLDTSYRFEAMTEKKSLTNALHRQQERIRTDEMMAARQLQAKREASITLKSAWNEALEHVAANKQAKSDMKQTQAELKITHKATLMVRRAAMRQLLDAEYRMFEKELHGQGRAFYVKRT